MAGPRPQFVFLRPRAQAVGTSSVERPYARRPAVLYGYARYALAQALTSCMESMGEVLVPALCCPVVAQTIRSIGATPVFYDVSPDLRTGPDRIIESINSKTTGIVVVMHYGWETADLQELAGLARDNVYLLADSAHSVPLAAHGNGWDRLYSIRKSLGITKGAAWVSSALPPDVAALPPEPSPAYVELEDRLVGMLTELPYIGIMDDVRATLQLVRRMRPSGAQYAVPSSQAVKAWWETDFEALALSRRRNARRYLCLFEESKSRCGARPAFGDVPDSSSPLGFPVWVDDAETVVSELWSYGVEATRWWPELPVGDDCRKYPNSYRAAGRLVQIPVHHELSDRDLEYVLWALARIVAR